MPLAIFDLDNTLIGGDSDYLWGEFLCDQGIISDKDSFQKMNDYFYHQYEIGKLDIYAWAEFSFKVLTEYSLNELNKLRQEFIDTKIRPIFLEKAQNCIDTHKRMGIQSWSLLPPILLIQSLLLKCWALNICWQLSQNLNQDGLLAKFQDFRVFNLERLTT